MNRSSAHDSVVALSGGHCLAFRDCGDPHGQALLYCHGMPGSRLEAAVFADAAARRGVRVIAFDRPGYGNTSPFGERRLGDEVADVRVLVDAPGLSTFDVLGFSGGGPHALAIRPASRRGSSACRWSLGKV